MRILQTPPRYPPAVGGVENAVAGLTRGLVGLGHEVAVLCANEPISAKEEVLEGVRVRRLPYVGKVANTNVTPRLPIAILREEFDLLHTHLPTPWSADWSAIAAAAKRKPLVLTYYNDIVGEGPFEGIARLYNRTGLRLLLRLAKKITVIQPEYQNSPHLRGLEEKVEVIPVGVDLARFRPEGAASDGRTLFFLSLLDRHHRYKGLEDLLSALVAVKEEVGDVKLLVGGGGELLDHYRRASARLGLEEAVQFLGFVPEEMVAKYYNRCDIFILPSTSRAQEGFGMVALEAMACGRPVICTGIVGVAEDVERVGGGLVVEAGKPEVLAEAIARLLQSGPEAQRMGAAGRRLVEERYGWRKVAERFEGLYEGLVG